MSDWFKEQQERTDRIEKAWDSNGLSAQEDLDNILKARSGVYTNTPENRKKGVVGQRYGKSKVEDNKEDKTTRDLFKNPYTQKDVDILNRIIINEKDPKIIAIAKEKLKKVKLTLNSNKPLIASNTSEMKWEKHPYGGEYSKYKMGTIQRSTEGGKTSYSISTGTGQKSEDNQNASSLEDAISKIDNISSKKKDNPENVRKEAYKWWSSLSINEQKAAISKDPFFSKMGMDYFRLHKTSIDRVYETHKKLNKSENIDIIFKAFEEGKISMDTLEKSWSVDLQKKNPGSAWRTVNGARILVGKGGEMIAANKNLKEKLESNKAKQGENKPVNERSHKEIGEAKQKIADKMPKPINEMTWEEFKPYGVEMQKQSSHSQPDSWYERQAKMEYDWAIKNNKSQYNTTDKQQSAKEEGGKKKDSKKEETSSSMQDKLDYYNELSTEGQKKYREDTVNFVMELNDKITNAKFDSEKKIYKQQAEFSDKLMQKINDIERKSNIPILKQSEKQFLEGDWKYGGTRQDLVNNWTEDAIKEIGEGKKFKDKLTAKKEVELMAKNTKDIDDERYRLLKLVAQKLK